MATRQDRDEYVVPRPLTHFPKTILVPIGDQVYMSPFNKFL